MARRRVPHAIALIGLVLMGEIVHSDALPNWLAWSAFLAAPALADDDDDDRDEARPRRRPPVREPLRRAAGPPSVRRELLASGVSEADLARVRAAGFAIVAARNLDILPASTVRLRIPPRLSEPQALQRLRALVPGAIVDFNHLYRPGMQPCRPEICFRFGDPDFALAGACAIHGAIGMIDTSVDTAHPALSGREIAVESLRGPGHRAAPSDHGTEIAILLMAAIAPESRFSLVAVDAFHRRSGADYADAFDIVAALDRLVQKSVAVANLSFAGPANALLARAGEKASERGLIVVAAAGNDGPAAAPRYPAAYRWAVAVTAVDRREQVFARAVRGPHLAFAAAGVRVQMPNRAMRPGPIRSGTSYAVPHVTAALAAVRAADPAAAPLAIVAVLARRAKDLGAPGRDPVFGWGLIGGPKSCVNP